MLGIGLQTLGTRLKWVPKFGGMIPSFVFWYGYPDLKVDLLKRLGHNARDQNWTSSIS